MVDFFCRTIIKGHKNAFKPCEKMFFVQLWKENKYYKKKTNIIKKYYKENKYYK